MKFYIVQNNQGSTLGCETALAAAHALAKSSTPFAYSIECVECSVNAETVRRLLGQLGGFATESTTVHS